MGCFQVSILNVCLHTDSVPELTDYSNEGPISLTITPDSANEVCTDIGVMMDSVIEDEEMFILTLDTSDMAVSISDPDRSRTVQLIDSTSKCRQ